MAATEPFTSDPFVVGKSAPAPEPRPIPAEESLCPVVSHAWVNSEYKHLVVEASPKALAVNPGQFFNLLCPSPDVGELFFRRPQSVYRIDRAKGRVEFLYKCVGRGTRGLATLRPGDELNMVGPLGVGFHLDPAWRHIVVLGRGVGIATLARSRNWRRRTASASPRSCPRATRISSWPARCSPKPAMSSACSTPTARARWRTSKKFSDDLIAQKRADAFFTCGSNRLFQLMKRVGKARDIPGQVAMEQVMACGSAPATSASAPSK